MSNNFTDIQKINLILEALNQLVDSDFSVEEFKALHREGRLARAYKLALELPHPPPPEFVMLELTNSLKSLVKSLNTAMKNIRALTKLKDDHELYDQDRTLLLDAIEEAGARISEEMHSARSDAQRMKFLIAPPKEQKAETGRQSP